MLTIKNVTGKVSVFFLALATLFTGCMPSGPRALLDGKELLEQGHYAEAVAKLQTATALISTNAVAWNYLGMAYHHTGEATNAEQAYTKALSLDRNLVEAHYNLGCLRLEQNHLEPAKTAFIAYTSLRGNSSEGWLKLGTAQLRLRELPAAEKSFREALALNPKTPEAQNGLGLIQLQRKDPRQAAQSFESALKAQPDYAPALLNLAIVNQDYLNNRPVALQKYHEYLALPARPQNWEAVHSVAQALEREINPPVVVNAPTAKSAPPVPLAPVSKPQIQPPAANVAAPRPASNSATHTISLAKPEPPATTTPKPAPVVSAPTLVDLVNLPPEQVVKPAQDADISSKPMISGRAEPSRISPSAKAEPVNPEKRTFLKQMNPLNLFRHSGPTNGQSVTVASTSGESSSRAAEAAAQAWPRYKYRNPSKPVAGDHSAAEPVFNRGSQAHKANQLPQAIQAYQQATQLDPAYFEAYYNLGSAASAAGNLSQALTAYETALALRPDSLDARYNLALALKQENYVVDSANELQKLLALYPNEARAHVILGNLYALQLKQPSKAKEHYQKVLEIDPRNPQAPAIRFWLTSH